MFHIPAHDDLYWLAMTVNQEAAGEHMNGKIAVAHAIVNRALKISESISDIVLKPWQFSGWNTIDPNRARIDDIKSDGENWHNCYAASCHALFRDRLNLTDPIEGRTLYLNEDALNELPLWWGRAGELDKGLKIGNHKFRRDI